MTINVPKKIASTRSTALEGKRAEMTFSLHNFIWSETLLVHVWRSPAACLSAVGLSLPSSKLSRQPLEGAQCSSGGAAIGKYVNCFWRL